MFLSDSSSNCACNSQISGSPFIFSQLHQTLLRQAKTPIISLQCGWTFYLANILMVVSCIFLEQKELIPHPSTFGPLKNLTITLWHPKQIPNIPRRKRKGNSGPEDREHEEQQNLIGYHGIQSAGKCPE